jgi:hypothetical protein
LIADNRSAGCESAGRAVASRNGPRPCTGRRDGQSESRPSDKGMREDERLIDRRPCIRCRANVKCSIARVGISRPIARTIAASGRDAVSPARPRRASRRTPREQTESSSLRAVECGARYSREVFAADAVCKHISVHLRGVVIDPSQICDGNGVHKHVFRLKHLRRPCVRSRRSSAQQVALSSAYSIEARIACCGV